MLRRTLVALLVLIGAGPALGQAAYPSRPITLIVPFAAGGPTDIVARIAADGLSRRLGQRVVIENVGGGGGTVGALRGARAAPDGYTLVLGQLGTHALSVGLYPDLAYDPVQDFAPVGLIASAPMVLVAKRSTPAATLPEFAAHVKANAARLSNGHAGIGATSHVACLLFNAAVGAKPASVPYRGTAPALADLVTGNIDYLCDQVTSVVGHVQAGSVKPMAVLAARRSPVLPDVPTSVEAGLPQVQATVWNALFFPKRTPVPIIEQVATALRAVLDDPEARRRLEDLGAEIPEGPERTPDALGALVRDEIERWTPILRSAGERAP